MIKRRHAHLLFAVTSLALVGALVWQGLMLHQNQQLSNAINTIPALLTSAEELDTSDNVYQHPAVQLTLGSALANGNNLPEAERLLNTLIGSEGNPLINANAQYNLANAYLREALKSGTQVSSKSLPMIELAKQRYRDLLATTPEHGWARYNLERALRLAPEGSERNDGERVEPVKSVNVIVPGFEKKDLP